jgi:hypothetical protein
MSSTPRKTYKLAERRARRAEALGGKFFPIEGENGEIVEIPYMSFWSEQLTKAVFDGDYPGDGEVLRMAVRDTDPEHGDKRVAELEALGLQQGDIFEIVKEVMKMAPDDSQDEDEKKTGDAGKSVGSSTS